MNFEGGDHCKIIRSIGVPLGLWPYRCTTLSKINGAIAVTIITLFIVAQLAVFTTLEFSGDLFFKIMTGMVPCIVYIVKYFFFVRSMDLVKYIFEWIQSDYDSLANERELELIEKSADRGRSISKVWLFSLLLGFVPIGLPYLSALFNIQKTVNQNRSMHLPLNVEYFVDQDFVDRYFYWITLHIDASIVLGISILFVTESVYIHFAIHACGLLELVGDRVERVLESSISNFLSAKTHSSVHDQLVATVELHQRTFKFIKYSNTSFELQYCVLIVLGVVSLSMNLCILARGILLMELNREMITAVVLVIIHFVYMGFGTYVGQLLLDKGDELFTKTYYARWHEAPLPVQKMLLYIRQRSMQPTAFVFGGLYTGSLELFSKLVNTSTSYFMMIYSTTA